MLLFGHLNINSLRNKFISISELIKGNGDTLINKYCLSNQFVISGYKFIGKNRNKFWGRIAFYITNRLTSKIIKIENLSDTEILTIEITIHKNKIIAAGIYKPPNISETDFTSNLETIISKLSNMYEKLILMRDFNDYQ